MPHDNSPLGHPAPDPTTLCELTGKPVSTWSEEWRHECELRHVLTLSKADRDAFFTGVKDTGNRGIVATRGVAAAERFKADLGRLEEIRVARKRA